MRIRTRRWWFQVRECCYWNECAVYFWTALEAAGWDIEDIEGGRCTSCYLSMFLQKKSFKKWENTDAVDNESWAVWAKYVAINNRKRQWKSCTGYGFSRDIYINWAKWRVYKQQLLLSLEKIEFCTAYMDFHYFRIFEAQRYLLGKGEGQKSEICISIRNVLQQTKEAMNRETIANCMNCVMICTSWMKLYKWHLTDTVRPACKGWSSLHYITFEKALTGLKTWNCNMNRCWRGSMHNQKEMPEHVLVANVWNDKNSWGHRWEEKT